MYFLVFLVISYAKNSKTALEIAQRKKHRGVVRYLSKPPTGKISVEGNGGAGVFKQGESIFSPLKGEVSQACERS